MARLRIITGDFLLSQWNTATRENNVFDDWATPVTHRGWACVCVALEKICRASGYRVFVHAKHVAWEYACGIRYLGQSVFVRRHTYTGVAA